MVKRRCAACGCLFVPRRNVPEQRYCAKRACQRTRRRRWQRQKLKADADYRANQAAAQQRWRERHPGYWRGYRERHPEYTARNRAQQDERNHRRLKRATGPSAARIANMDVCEAEPPPLFQALTGAFRSRVPGLQRWTRTS